VLLNVENALKKTTDFPTLTSDVGSCSSSENNFLKCINYIAVLMFKLSTNTEHPTALWSRMCNIKEFKYWNCQKEVAL
jgi:hypothetical protein